MESTKGEVVYRLVLPSTQGVGEWSPPVLPAVVGHSGSFMTGKTVVSSYSCQVSSCTHTLINRRVFSVVPGPPCLGREFWILTGNFFWGGGGVVACLRVNSIAFCMRCWAARYCRQYFNTECCTPVLLWQLCVVGNNKTYVGFHVLGPDIFIRF